MAKTRPMGSQSSGSPLKGVWWKFLLLMAVFWLLSHYLRSLDRIISIANQEHRRIYEEPRGPRPNDVHDEGDSPFTCISGACPMCGSSERTLWTTEHGHQLHKCAQCGLLYIHPMPDHPPNVTYPERWVDAKVDAMKQKVLEFFDEHALREGRVHGWLDVGAGNGELLRALQGLMRSDALISGLETSPVKLENARNRGVMMVNRPFSEISERYDVVSFMNVLSHLQCPVAFVHSLTSLLKPQGCLFMSTGNLADLGSVHDNPSKSLSLPDHVLFAGRSHAVELMEKVGLEVVRVKEYDHFWHNYPKFKRGPFRAIYLKACLPPEGSSPKRWNAGAVDTNRQDDVDAIKIPQEVENQQEHPQDEGASKASSTVDDGLTDEERRELIIQSRPAPGTEQSNVCPICGETEHTVFLRENGYTLGKCSRCGFLYVNPMPFGIDPDKKTYREKWEGLKVPAMKQKIQDFFAAEALGGIRNWLDVGCGNGELLLAIRQTAPQIEAMGIETTQYKIDAAVAKGLKVEKKDLSEFPDNHFDMVTAMNVLSHVARPVDFYAALARIVKPGGCIWMSTGNAADVPVQDSPSRFDLPDHLCFAGKAHVYTIFHRIGFRMTLYKEYKHFWHNYRPLKPGRFRAIYAKACKPL